MSVLVEQASLESGARTRQLLMGEVDAAREVAREEGLREGRLSGTEEAQQNFNTELKRIRSIADQLQQSMQAGIEGLENIAVAIAFESVCKIVGELAVTQAGIQAIVNQVTAHVLHAEKVLVRLHPSDLSVLRAAGALDTSLASGAAVSWVEDKSIKLGGCVIEVDSGELDARLETQMHRLRTTLEMARRNATTQVGAPSPKRRKTDGKESARQVDYHHKIS